MLVKPLMDISTEIPYFSAICARQRIMRTRNQFCEAIKNSEGGCWPSLKTLSLLRLWSMIFPCSDFRHPVMTPAILLMCEYLMRCPIKSGRDIAIGSFLCSMVLSVAKQSQKFCPEAIIFLRTLLMAATQNKAALDSESQFYHLMELKALRPLLCVQERINEISPLNFMMVMDMAEDSSFFWSDNFRRCRPLRHENQEFRQEVQTLRHENQEFQQQLGVLEEFMARMAASSVSSMSPTPSDPSAPVASTPRAH